MPRTTSNFYILLKSFIYCSNEQQLLNENHHIFKYKIMTEFTHSEQMKWVEMALQNQLCRDSWILHHHSNILHDKNTLSNENHINWNRLASEVMQIEKARAHTCIKWNEIRTRMVLVRIVEIHIFGTQADLNRVEAANESRITALVKRDVFFYFNKHLKTSCGHAIQTMAPLNLK